MQLFLWGIYTQVHVGMGREKMAEQFTQVNEQIFFFKVLPLVSAKDDVLTYPLVCTIVTNLHCAFVLRLQPSTVRIIQESAKSL